MCCGKNISGGNIAKKQFSEIDVNTKSSIPQQSGISAHVTSYDNDSEDSNALNETENYADTSFRTEDGEESSESEEDYVEAAEQSSPTDDSKFIIFWFSLLTLLRFCALCNAPARVTKAQRAKTTTWVTLVQRLSFAEQ